MQFDQSRRREFVIRPPCERPAIRATGVTEYLNRDVVSVGFDAGELHHLAPLFSFFGDELAEVDRRAWKCSGAPLGKPCLHLGIDEGRVDLRVELVDDFGRSIPRRADAMLILPGLALA